MSAPDKLWLLDWALHGHRAQWADGREYPVDEMADEGDVEYICADIVDRWKRANRRLADELDVKRQEVKRLLRERHLCPWCKAIQGRMLGTESKE